jgi:hypothetical protein
MFFPSTCVGLRYGHPAISLEVFLGSVDSVALRPGKGLVLASRDNVPPDFPGGTPYMLEPSLPIEGPPILLRHPIVQTITVWYRNVDLFPIDYAFRPRLRDRLTLSGRTFLRKP